MSLFMDVSSVFILPLNDMPFTNFIFKEILPNVNIVANIEGWQVITIVLIVCLSSVVRSFIKYHFTYKTMQHPKEKCQRSKR